MATLACRGLSRRYPGFVLGPLEIEFPRGITCVVGANGAGKSTLFRALAGIERRRHGTVVLDGRPLRGQQIGFLPQDLSFPRRATCEQYLQHIAWLRAVPRPERSARVVGALADVGLGDRATSRISTLSGGMRRRLGLAHAILHAPEVLMLDEPTVGLDPLQRVAMRETIAAASDGRVTIVATHLVDDVAALADRVVVLRHGRPAFIGTVPELARTARPEAPGASDLEKAIATTISDERDVVTSRGPSA